MYKSRILIVDDVEINRDILASILEEDYEIAEACDGQMAIDMIEKDPKGYQLVLLDLKMPVMDGFEVLRVMKEREWINDLPVVVISAESSSEAISQAYELGAVDYFSKPFDAFIINRHVHNVLALYEREYRDYLTGGYNRKGLIRMMRMVLKDHEKYHDLSVLYFNIKNFKAINELYGIEFGDKILRFIHQDMENSPLNPLICSRLEADHFVCLAKRENIDYGRLTGKCRKNVVEIENKRISVRLRCGIYHIDDFDMSASRIIDRAKLAKTYIVDEFVKPYAIFDKSMRIDYVGKAEFAAEFADAIENREFKVYYQPVMEAATGRIVSAEALVRWQHPVKGFVSPGVFLPTLEKDGHISELDWYVTSNVFRMMKERIQEKKSVVPVSVNLSWMDFYDEQRMEKTLGRFRDNELPKGLVRFEITETSYASLQENRRSVLDEMRSLGIKILLDDFGSGYSSFGMLKDYDFDILKLDMSFIRQIDNNEKVRSIIKSIIDMCHQLGIRVVAEGAETQEHVDFLWKKNCDYIQGYYYSKPLPEEEFLALLDEYDKDNKIVDYRASDLGAVQPYFREGINYFSKDARKMECFEELAVKRLVVEQRGVGIICGVYDEKQSMSYITDTALAVLGYTFEELHSKCQGSYLKLIAESDYENFVKGGMVPPGVYHVYGADGSINIVSESRINSELADGTKVWAIAICRD